MGTPPSEVTHVQRYTLYTAAKGPTALATSLEPWAKALTQAVHTCRWGTLLLGFSVLLVVYLAFNSTPIALHPPS